MDPHFGVRIPVICRQSDEGSLPSELRATELSVALQQTPGGVDVHTQFFARAYQMLFFGLAYKISKFGMLMKPASGLLI